MVVDGGFDDSNSTICCLMEIICWVSQITVNIMAGFVGCKFSLLLFDSHGGQRLVSLCINSSPSGEYVSADLKGSQFSRCRGEPESLPVVAEHTNAAAAVRRQAVTIASFFPAE